jgi:hypothetical protein
MAPGIRLEGEYVTWHIQQEAKTVPCVQRETSKTTEQPAVTFRDGSLVPTVVADSRKLITPVPAVVLKVGIFGDYFSGHWHDEKNLSSLF